MRTVHTLLVAAIVAVCLAPLRAQDANAVVIYQVGQVSVMNGTRGDAVALSKGSLVHQQQVIVTGPDGYAQFQVSDGSTFEVFNNSKVVFRESLGNWRDLLNVWIGRVKVIIQHAPGKPNPNSVSSPTAVISVRGTVFDVVVEDDDGTTLVSVDEGIVGVRNLTAPGDAVTLTQGQVVRVFRNQPLLPPRADRGNWIHKGLDAVREAIWVMAQHPSGPTGGGVPGTTSAPSGGVQGDKGKGGNTPGTPPAPGTPPVPGGG